MNKSFFYVAKVTANIQDGRTIASLASEYGVSTASINNWIRDWIGYSN